MRGRMADMDPQLQQIIELQAEQNQLLRKYLWRIRFSLLTLLVLTTAICCGLGVVVYKQQKSSPTLAAPLPSPIRNSSTMPRVAPFATPSPAIPPSASPAPNANRGGAGPDGLVGKLRPE
jgi:hypothetical protein